MTGGGLLRDLGVLIGAKRLLLGVTGPPLNLSALVAMGCGRFLVDFGSGDLPPGYRSMIALRLSCIAPTCGSFWTALFNESFLK